MAHTPGPWKAVPPRMGTAWVIDAEATVSPIAMLYGSNTQEQMRRARSGETEANARLIAAAPELLEALELFANLDRSVNSDLWAIDPQYCEQARAALAKARGE